VQAGGRPSAAGGHGLSARPAASAHRDIVSGGEGAGAVGGDDGDARPALAQGDLLRRRPRRHLVGRRPAHAASVAGHMI
jgi:hypothetical protein